MPKGEKNTANFFFLQTLHVGGQRSKVYICHESVTPPKFKVHCKVLHLKFTKPDLIQYYNTISNKCNDLFFFLVFFFSFHSDSQSTCWDILKSHSRTGKRENKMRKMFPIKSFPPPLCLRIVFCVHIDRVVCSLLKAGLI